jgi:hypothetical protein
MSDAQAASQAELAALIRAWCAEQLAPWLARKQLRADAMAEMDRLNATDPNVFLLLIQRGQVSVAAKPASASAALYPAAHERAGRYRAFVQSLAGAFMPDLATVAAIHVGPSLPAAPKIPLFAAEKPRGHSAVLLPDLALLGHLVADAAPAYAERGIGAVFVGATEGGLITEDIARRHALPRLRAAARFRGHAEVQFRLPDLVGCESEATKTLLRQQGIGNGVAPSWAEQLRQRFIIAMDGNGADAARIAATLRAGGVLLAYPSAHALFYQSGLIPWLHYVPLAGDDDVEAVLRIERAHPGFFAPVATIGQRFAASALAPDALRAYTAALLRAYATACFTDDPAMAAPPPQPQPAMPAPVAAATAAAAPRPAGPPAAPAPAPGPISAPAPTPAPVQVPDTSTEPGLDILVHVGGLGDVRGSIADWAGGRGRGRAIEGIELIPRGGFPAADVAIQAVLRDGTLSEWAVGGTYCGSRGRAEPLQGFTIRLSGGAAERFVLYYSATFVDGSEVGPLPAGETCQAPSKASLEAMRLLLLPIG